MATLWLRTRPRGPSPRSSGSATSPRPPGTHDDRSARARRADTLIDVIRGSSTVLHLTPVPDVPGAGDSTENRRGEALAPSTAGSRPRWGTRQATVHVTVPWTTLARVEDLPRELAGYRAQHRRVRRELAADATWRRIITDPATGAVLDVGTTTYTPPAALAAHIHTPRQRLPLVGCRQPAAHCDVDHIQPHPRGPTAEHNLARLVLSDTEPISYPCGHGNPRGVG